MTTIGVIGLDHLIDPLRQRGVGVVSGPDFQTAVLAIRTAREAGPFLGVLVGDGPHEPPTGLVTWMSRQRRNFPVVVVESGGQHLATLSSVVRVPQGASVDQILSAIYADQQASFPSESPSAAPVAAPTPPPSPAVPPSQGWGAPSPASAAPLPPPPPVAPPVAAHPVAAPAPVAPPPPEPVIWQPVEEGTFTFDDVAFDPEPPPAPAPQPEPQPVYQPQPAPAPQPEPQPVYQPQPAPAPQPEPQPVYQPQPAPAPQPEPQPFYQPAPQPEPEHQQTPPLSGNRRDLFDQIAEAPGVSDPGDYDMDGATGTVIFVIAAKGGVGKSSVAAGLADRAARDGLSSLVVDMNRGQADLAGYLRVRTPRTIADAAMRAGVPLADAVMTAEEIASSSVRTERKSAAPMFDAVFGPPDSLARASQVSERTYHSIIAQAARQYRVVVVDTQTLEAVDTTALIDRVVLPMLLDGTAYAVGIAGGSSVSVANLVRRFEGMQQAGVSADRLMVLFNGTSGPGVDVGFSVDQASGLFHGLARVVPSVEHDSNIPAITNAGATVAEHPNFRAALHAILHRATGLQSFAPTGPDNSARRKKSGGLFGRRKDPSA
jgi:Mrp family chromosome partitioning ATPase